MAEHSKNKIVSDMPEGSGYNCIFRHNWRVLGTCALPSTWIFKINSIVDGRGRGWYFIPHKNMAYTRENWYEDQTLVLSFSEEVDMIQTILQLDVKS